MSKSQWNAMLTPEKLKEYGVLESEVHQGEFDPNGNWELSWRVWLLKRSKNDINHRGYISIKKECTEDENKFNLHIEQKILQVKHHTDYATKAFIQCEKDIFSTPDSWNLSRSFYNHAYGEEINSLSKNESGEIKAGVLKTKLLGNENTFCFDEYVTSNWSLIEAIMRCSDKLENSKFTLLDELDKIKQDQTIKFMGSMKIAFGNSSISVKRYDQIGKGLLPWSYYIDEFGRLVLAISGLLAYVLDSRAKDIHIGITSAISKKEKPEDAYQKMGRDDSQKPNILLITTDEQSINTISSYGNKFLKTPNLDRLAENGVSFMNNYCTNPVCTASRSSIFTGRTSCETGAIKNEMGIREDIPNIGQWLSNKGYDTIYCGKWHVPEANPETLNGFTVLPGGLGGQGTLGDQAISSASAGWLLNRKRDKPFFLTVNFLQPHDICNWHARHKAETEIGHGILETELPPLPDNFQYDTEPDIVSKMHKMEGVWSEKIWRYYIWAYYRMMEEVDAEIGRVLNALEASGYSDNTIIIFTSDHGDGAAHHKLTAKNFLYDEAAKVPLIISGNGLVKNKQNYTNLTSGLDIMQTVCDFAGVDHPKESKGISLKPICEGKPTIGRNFVVVEANEDMGRMIRIKDWKLIAYREDSTLQLFDMKNDPGEAKNLAQEPKYFEIINELKRMLNEWEAGLDRAPNSLPQFKI